MFFIPEHLRDTDRRLDNWGRWARKRRSAARAKSLEGRYVRDSELDKEDSGARLPTLDVNEFDASIVDMGLAPFYGFEWRMSLMLKVYYVDHGGMYSIARRAKVKSSTVRGEFERALAAAHHSLPKIREGRC